MTAFMSSRASDSVNVGTFWNSPSFSSLAASSSPVIFSRVREVGACTGAGMLGGDGRDVDGADGACAVVKLHWLGLKI